MSAPRPLVRGRASALLDRRFLHCAVELAPGLRWRESEGGPVLHDEHLGVDVGLNASACGALRELTEAADVEQVCERWALHHPGAPVRRDLLRLVAELNAVGVLNIRALVGEGSQWWWLRPARLAPVLAWLARGVVQASCTRRGAVVWPAGAPRLAVVVGWPLLPLVAGTALVSLSLIVSGVGGAVQLMAAAALLVVSVIAHELGHAVTLAAANVTYIVSLGGARVLVGRSDQPQRWRAAVAGPLAGAAVGAGGVVGALATRAGLDVALALAIGAGHLLSLTPWAADGRLLVGRDDGTITDPTPSTIPSIAPLTTPSTTPRISS